MVFQISDTNERSHMCRMMRLQAYPRLFERQRCIRNQGKGIIAHLVVPLFVEVVYQAVLAFVSTAAPSAVSIERNATVASAGGQEACAGGCQNNENILIASVLPSPIPGRQTYREEAPNTSPHGVVGQLSPPSLMHDGALVDAATHKVHQHRDERNHAEHTTRAQCLCLGVYAAAGKVRAALEEVCAVVDRSDEGDAALGERIGLAEQRDDGGLAALRLVGGGLLLLVRISVLVLLIIVVVVADDFARE